MRRECVRGNVYRRLNGLWNGVKLEVIMVFAEVLFEGQPGVVPGVLSFPPFDVLQVGV